MKERSDFLRHPLMEELVNENTYINEVSWPLSAPERPHHPLLPLKIQQYHAHQLPA